MKNTEIVRTTYNISIWTLRLPLPTLPQSCLVCKSNLFTLYSVIHCDRVRHTVLVHTIRMRWKPNRKSRGIKTVPNKDDGGSKTRIGFLSARRF